jgi:hypothetical protein
MQQETAETSAAIAVKLSPPASVSIATLAGYQVSELLMWATLLYTILMIAHKVYTMVYDVIERKRLAAFRAAHLERRVGLPDSRPIPLERRGK